MACRLEPAVCAGISYCRANLCCAEYLGAITQSLPARRFQTSSIRSRNRKCCLVNSSLVSPISRRISLCDLSLCNDNSSILRSCRDSIRHHIPNMPPIMLTTIAAIATISPAPIVCHHFTFARKTLGLYWCVHYKPPRSVAATQCSSAVQCPVRCSGM